MRMGFSNLKNDLFLKGCIPNPICDCGKDIENAAHFLLKCDSYEHERVILINGIKEYTSKPIKLKTLLYGVENLCIDSNMGIFDCVYHYIESTKRF